MNNLLLIAILVISTITMISSLFVAIVVAKKSDKDVIKNAGKIVGIVFVCLLVVFLTIGVSKIDKKSSSSDNKKTEETESSDDELSAAGFNKVSLDEYLRSGYTILMYQIVNNKSVFYGLFIFIKKILRYLIIFIK